MGGMLLRSEIFPRGHGGSQRSGASDSAQRAGCLGCETPAGS